MNWEKFIFNNHEQFIKFAVKIRNKLNYMEAEDIVQDVYLNVYKKNYNCSELRMKWIIMASIKNACFNWFRKKITGYSDNFNLNEHELPIIHKTDHTVYHTPLDDLTAVEPSNIDPMTFKMIMDTIESKLTHREWSILYKFASGYSVEELARQYKIDLTTVRVTVHKARKKIHYLSSILT